MRQVSIVPGAPTVPVVGLGCMGLTWGYTDPSIERPAQVSFLRDAVDLGVRLFDTSDQYGPFTNETLIGEALGGITEGLFVATKGGLVVDTHGVTDRDGSPEHLRSALPGSLQQLGVDHVDLYQLHRVDPAVPLERSWEAMALFRRCKPCAPVTGDATSRGSRTMPRK